MGIIRNVKKALTWLRPGRKARALFAGRPWKRAPKHLRSIAIPTRKNGLIGPAKPLRMTRPSSYQGLLIPAAPTPDPSTVQTVTIKPSPPIAHPSYVNPRISLQTAIDACRLWYKIRVTANGKETTAAPGGTFRSFQLLGVPMAKPAHTAKAYLKGVRVGVTFSIPLGEQPDFDFDPHTGRATHNTLGQFRNNESLTPDQKLALAREEDDFVIGEALRLRCVGVRFQLQVRPSLNLSCTIYMFPSLAKGT